MDTKCNIETSKFVLGIAEMLGVKIGEEFHIDKAYGKYRFFDNSLQVFNEFGENWQNKHYYFWLLLISGKFKIVKIQKNIR